ncbi:MAG TPA: PIG-L family deacetylase [Bryobacteraceae bacterium]|nr:PIG-L family deacetylase [Bryobacteraceae bacterium]
MKFLSICLLATLAFAQLPYSTNLEPPTLTSRIPANEGSAALWQSLKKLHTRASLIMITAHPDDEDGGMLAYESRGQGARVALLTLNRGEGGANIMSNDYFDALGLIRTMELLAADQYYAVDQYWTRVIDYGFSKTKAESISRWTHERVLYDVVRTVRMVRPLVITSVFVGGPSDGHGNHQTAGAMAQEVFKAAGDPNVFPDQIKAGLHPWSPLKDYARQPFAHNPPLSADVEIPEGAYDPMLGISYVQLAREGLGFQKSQHGGPAIPHPGQQLSGYHRFRSLVESKGKEQSFFDGIDVSLSGIADLAEGSDASFLRSGLKQINASVEEATQNFSAPHPEQSAPALATGLQKTISLLAQIDRSRLSDNARYNIRHELEIKRVQFNNALAEALGLSLSATVAPAKEPSLLERLFLGDPDTFRTAIPGQTFAVDVAALARGNAAVKLDGLGVSSIGQATPWSVETKNSGTPKSLVSNEPHNVKFTVRVPKDARFTQPYFTRPDIEQSYYDLKDEKLLGHSFAPFPLAASADFRFGDALIHLSGYVQTVKSVTGEGTVYEPLAVAPAIGVVLTPRAGIVPLNERAFPLTAVVHSNVKGPAQGTVHLALPVGWSAKPASATFAISDDGQDQSVTFTVSPQSLAETHYKITAVAECNGQQYSEGYETVGYPGLQPYFLYRPASYRFSGVNVQIAPDLRVGYIAGTGDDVPSSLERLGVHVDFLGPADVATGDLGKYDAILLGIRTYAARSDLRTYNSRLLDYVKNGGVVIVQYNTPEFDHDFGPYPYSMTADPEEVTDEASKVNILEPSNPLFNWPNKISEADFGGWVEERGSKWMKTWDPRYQALLETHDEGQSPQRGGLLYAKYGKGVYIYNAYAFYRELPEGVPGAYRIFANMISLPKNPRR